MPVKVLVFGAAKDIIGSAAVKIEIGDKTLKPEGFRNLLLKKYPDLAQISSFRLAVNAVYADKNTTIGSNDEVAIIPPTNGG